MAPAPSPSEGVSAGQIGYVEKVVEVSHRQVTVDGALIHTVESGDSSAIPILLLHGWPQSWQVWQNIMEAAGSTARTIAIDLPGVGESKGDSTDGTKRALAEVVHGFVDQLNLHRFVLVGHDIGGMVAYPCERSTSSATVGTSPSGYRTSEAETHSHWAKSTGADRRRECV